MVERPMRSMLETASKRLSLHMPGAQGVAPFGAFDPYRLDTTELAVTDDLYRPEGAIVQAERLAAKSAGAANTLMLTGGSTAGMHAMLLYAARRGQRVILPRNVHISAVHLCAMAGVEPVFALPSFTADGLVYTPDEAYLEALSRAGDAVAMLVVRPDYYGLLGFPARAAAEAHRRGMLVLCDEAHGAHLNWDASTPTALALGADISVQSAHKTLPALTACAWLHAAPTVDAARLRRMLRMAQTSSPSFVNLLALDDARAWMDEHGAGAVERLHAATEDFYRQVAPLGYRPPDAPCARDGTRVALEAPEGGFALDRALAARGIDVEMSDERRVVCILSLMDGAERLAQLARALERAARERGRAEASRLPLPLDGLPPREVALDVAAFAPSEDVPLARAAGRVSAAQVGLYPPGVALLTAGERVTPELRDYLMTLEPSRLFGVTEDGEVRCLK